MSEKVRLLDQALEMSEAELEHLMEGEFELAEQSSAERHELIRRILSMDDDAKTEQLMSKLNQLRTMQNRLTGEAKRLHDELRQDLMRARQETKRYSGYKQAANGTPEKRNRLFHKRG
ncbi:hypothetical protein [Desulfohalovibrio reitneri]|uniref:hypothetical protein n=1 Tax=Desulfohalovibrio reitneri TaxID=1307759 RepID=UPI0005535378|nr:hypothetical protein [Desulfohalovibrio reitneri]